MRQAVFYRWGGRMLQAEITIYDDQRSLGVAAAGRWLGLCEESIAERGAFHVALAGGSTPRQLYQLLSRAEMSPKVDWQHVYIYFGDERSVPCDHPDSNFRMATEALLDHVPIPRSNICRVETERGDMVEVASRYDSALMEMLPKADGGIPQFDLILLGIGPDGHTASLFPGTDILQQQKRFFDAVYVKQKATWRASITFPIINHARHVLFLVAGVDKRPVIQKIFSRSQHPPLLPVQMLKPAGRVEMYLDSDAAGEFKPD